MNLQQIAFDMCRYYLEDCKVQLSDDDYSRILGWIRSRNLEKLCTAPDHFEDAFANLQLNRILRQIAAFFKKNGAFRRGDVCLQQAEESFRKGELLCKITNKRLDHYYSFPDRLDPQLRKMIQRASSFIDDALGDFSDFFGDIPQWIRVTSGASSTAGRRNSAPYLKIGIRHVPVTARCKPYTEALYRTFGFDPSFSIVVSNRVEVVSKNWKTDRTIACEPIGNLPFQLAFDGYIKDRLKPYGVNLSFQALNQRLARRGSIDGSLATLDLSMASDTVSKNTVSWLFPPEWEKFLFDIRSQIGVGFNQTFLYEKFSSMGNGSTFGIETLIFRAFIYAVGCNRDFAVYGDDIIIPTRFVNDYVRLLRFFGFRLNEDKSFSSGPFRESCGKDWFSGVDVTPFYLRGKTHGKPELSHVINGVVTIGLPEGKLWEFCRKLVHEYKLVKVPFSDDSTSGIFVDTPTAYKLKILRPRTKDGNTCPWTLGYRRYVSKTKTIRVRDSRTYYLWHLKFWNRRRSPIVGEGEVSEIPVLGHKYRLKWGGWTVPPMATPDHLYWWSDYVLADAST